MKFAKLLAAVLFALLVGVSAAPGIFAETLSSDPVLSSASCTAEGVKLSWNKVSGAELYRVFYKEPGDTAWNKIGDTSALSYTWKGAKSGTQYSFTVRCVTASGKGVGGYEKQGRSLYYIATPKISSLEANASGIRVNWGAVNGASYYTVFCKTAGGSWQSIGDAEGTAFLWKDGVFGETYTFMVRPRNSEGKLCGAIDKTGKSIAYFAAPKLLSAQNEQEGLKVSWEKTPGAAKYRVFYKTEGGSWKKAGDTASNEYLWKGGESGTEYVFTVRCLPSAGEYTSTCDQTGVAAVRIATPRVSALSNLSSGVKITWEPVGGAASYTVFCKKAGESWQSIAATESTSYTWKGAVSRETYTFMVRPRNSEGKLCGAMDKTGRSITFLAAPELVSAQSTTEGIKITWNKVAGAEKYRVFYRTAESGSWKKAGDTASNSYLWKSPASGKDYIFTVRCLSSAGEYTSGCYNTGVSLSYIATPKLSSVGLTASGIQISWGKVGGATGYTVFCKTEGGSWESIGKTESTSFTWAEGEFGGKYTFMVRPLNSEGKVCGAIDKTGVSITNLIAPKLTTAKSTNSGITLTWNKIAGAKTYRVFFKTESGEWRSLVNTASNTYTWKNPTVNATYTFTVRCVAGGGESCNPNYGANEKTVTHNFGGNYIDIDLSEQKLYFYKKGALVLKSDIVSGNLATGAATPTGVYYVFAKERNTYLLNNSFVKYWMPFNGGIGLHDAYWRYGKFGGNYYKTDGSHGCINLPEDVAKKIYDNITIGYKVVVHK